MNCAVWWLLGAQGLRGDFLLCAALTLPQHYSLCLRMNILARQGMSLLPFCRQGAQRIFSRAKVAEMG